MPVLIWLRRNVHTAGYRDQAREAENFARSDRRRRSHAARPRSPQPRQCPLYHRAGMKRIGACRSIPSAGSPSSDNIRAPLWDLLISTSESAANSFVPLPQNDCRRRCRPGEAHCHHSEKDTCPAISKVMVFWWLPFGDKTSARCRRPRPHQASDDTWPEQCSILIAWFTSFKRPRSVMPARFQPVTRLRPTGLWI